MNVIDRLVSLFIKFPGIGLRQARRFVYFLLSAEPKYVDELVSLLQTLKTEIRQCASCFRFSTEISEKNACSLCIKNSDSSTLIVVEKDIDLENIQKSNLFSGAFFVLGELSSPLQKESPARISHLLARIKRDAAVKKLEEIIIALNAHPDGDYTTLRLKNFLEPVVKKYHIKISTLGRGMSTGSELEYADPETIRHAIENRR